MDAAFLLVAGTCAGLASSVAGLASLISYPALLVVGATPVAANVSNTVAQSGTAIGVAVGSQPELAGQRRLIVALGATAVVLGGLGAATLLLLPAESFEAIVPVLIALASTLLLLRKRIQRWGSGSLSPRHPLAASGLGFGFFYAGYFGAAAGVLMLGILGAVLTDSHARVNALKNVLLGLSNVTAGLGFVIFGPVEWAAVIPLGIGFGLGGYLGPRVVRRVDGDVLRVATALAGLVLAVVLAVRTY